jgi:hypothetical protein
VATDNYALPQPLTHSSTGALAGDQQISTTVSPLRALGRIIAGHCEYLDDELRDELEHSAEQFS